MRGVESRRDLDVDGRSWLPGERRGDRAADGAHDTQRIERADHPQSGADLVSSGHVQEGRRVRIRRDGGIRTELVIAARRNTATAGGRVAVADASQHQVARSLRQGDDDGRFLAGGIAARPRSAGPRPRARCAASGVRIWRDCSAPIVAGVRASPRRLPELPTPPAPAVDRQVDGVVRHGNLQAVSPGLAANSALTS